MASRGRLTPVDRLEFVDRGIVEFIARGVTDGRPFVQRERSQFRKLDGAWFYTTG